MRRIAVSCLWLSFAMALVGAHAALSDRPSGRAVLPSLSLTLKPHATREGLDYIDAMLVIPTLAVAEGKTLVQMPLVIASIPTVRYDGNALTASDAKGPIGLMQKDGAPQSFGTQRDWIASRATSGPVTLRFRALPRRVDAGTRPGPLFDLRAEGGGLNGAGLTFLPHLTSQQKYQIRLHWDLAGLPPSYRAVSCLGDGDASIEGTSDALTECYYAVGPLRIYPPGSGKTRRFGIYWLSDTPFDVPAVAAQIQKLFQYMSAFFHDAGGSYRVFIRKNPYNSGGGTALRRSFMFGWNAERPPTVTGMEGLLAHEMTHNWPALEGEHGDTSWYSEGTAEYYSILLSWRAGVIDAGEFLKRINQRARGYYQNPLQSLTLQQADARYWKESNASYVPYGRGWMYLAITDAQIRKHSGGKRSLDDLVVTLVDRARRGQSYTLADWVRLVSEELGPHARTEYEAMVRGVRLVPPPNAFGPCFRPETFQVRLTDLGFDESSLLEATKSIRGVRPGSNAALAGLKDGDEVVRRSLPDQDDPNREMTLTIRRDGTERVIHYEPEGKAVEAWRWVRVREIPEADCRY